MKTSIDHARDPRAVTATPTSWPGKRSALQGPRRARALPPGKRSRTQALAPTR